ncbi:hypothetical protein IFM89_037031 [Coptis chinensis]|uniref:Uncharacterized protein n=1 Tax=Coptis chinensis TaxID=261450 RepID=A0A835LQD1_9MAGN|nr:hypothetical protein IFM89_037031 [Coptis chinensis]
MWNRISANVDAKQGLWGDVVGTSDAPYLQPWSGDDPNLMHKIQDPLYLDRIKRTYKGVETTLKSFRGHLLGLEKPVAIQQWWKSQYHTPFSIAFARDYSLLINMSNSTSFDVSVVNDVKLHPAIEELKGIPAMNPVNADVLPQYALLGLNCLCYFEGRPGSARA